MNYKHKTIMTNYQHARILQDDKDGLSRKLKTESGADIERALDHFFKTLKHTPGPWVPDGCHLKDPSNDIVAHVLFTGKPEGQTEANSKLIACAPDMLRTLGTYSGTVQVRAEDGEDHDVVVAKAKKQLYKDGHPGMVYESFKVQDNGN